MAETLEAQMDVGLFVREFAPRLRAGDAAVVCGAGVSVPSNLPDWKELLEPAREELGLPTTFSDLSLLAAYYVTEIPGGRVRLNRAIRERLQQGSYQPNPIHDALWRLPLSYLWSLNFDNLLELAHEARFHHRPHVIQTDSEMRGSLARSGCTLVKMHGSINDLDDEGRRLVLTRDDFDRYVEEFPRTWSRLLADFYTKSILFVGISFADPNMQALLRLVRTGGDSITQRHYSVVTSIPDSLPKETAALYRLQRADLRRGGVRSVEVGSYDELPTMLEGLAVAARKPAVMIAGSLPPHDEATTMMQALGTNLATVCPDVSLVHGGSDTIDTIPHRFAEQIEREGRYADDRLIQVRRSEPHGAHHQATVTERRLGRIVFPGTHAADVRRDLCSRARVCVVIGGGDHTKAEVEECLSQGVPVIPIPTGDKPDGVQRFSQTLWERMVADGNQALAAFADADPIVLANLVLRAVAAHIRDGG